MAFWGNFELKISKIFVIFGNSTLEFIEMSNIKQKKKNQIWDQKCLLWVLYA